MTLLQVHKSGCVLWHIASIRGTGYFDTLIAFDAKRQGEHAANRLHGGSQFDQGAYFMKM
jgi:hypothetical protein